MKLFSKLRYYAASIITLLTRFERPFQIIKIFLGAPGSLPAEIKLKDNHLRFSVREAMDVWVIKETCVDGDYLPSQAYQPDWQVVDIGAGLGDFTILAALNCPDGRVLAFEPLESSFRLLQHNLSLNGFNNVAVYQQATAAVEGTMKPESTEKEAVSIRFVSERAAAENLGKEIPIITLAEILERLPDGHCHLMKIDCEGCEFDLLLNSPPELLNQIDRLTIETHDGYSDYTAKQLAAYLIAQGFKVKQRPNPVHGYLGFIYAERVT